MRHLHVAFPAADPHDQARHDAARQSDAQGRPRQVRGAPLGDRRHDVGGRRAQPLDGQRVLTDNDEHNHNHSLNRVYSTV